MPLLWYTSLSLWFLSFSRIRKRVYSSNGFLVHIIGASISFIDSSDGIDMRSFGLILGDMIFIVIMAMPVFILKNYENNVSCEYVSRSRDGNVLLMSLYVCSADD